jgi:hypothetical protein
MGRFETKWLSRPENLVSLADPPGPWIDNTYLNLTLTRQGSCIGGLRE